MKITREQLINIIKEELGDPAGEAEYEKQKKARTAWKRKFTSVEEVNAIADLMESDPEFEMLSPFVDEFRRRSQRGTPPQDVLEVVLPEYVSGGLIAKVILKARERLPADETPIKKPESPALSGAEMDRIAPSLEESKGNKMKITKSQLKQIIEEELKATLEEQKMEYTPQQKQLFKKVTGKGLGQNFVQRIASIFKGKDVEYLSPEALDTVMGVTKEEDVVTLAKGHARDAGTGEIGGFYTSEDSSTDGRGYDDMFKLAMEFIRNGSIPETRKDVFEDSIEVSMQHPYSKDFIRSTQELQSAGKDALQTVRDGQELIRSISQSNLNLSVDDFAALEVAVDGGARFLDRLTSFFSTVMYPTEDEAERQRLIDRHNAETRRQLAQMLQDKEAEAEKARQRNARDAEKPLINYGKLAAIGRDLRPGTPTGQQITTGRNRNEGKLKMKITKQQLINIIKEELAVVVEQDGDEKITGTGQAQTASARFQKLRTAATAALEDEEITAQEREVLSLIEKFFAELAGTDGVDLSKKRSQIEPLLQRIKNIVAPGADDPDTTTTGTGKDNTSKTKVPVSSLSS